MPESSRNQRRSGGFPTTQWSIVLAAGRNSTEHSRNALSGLCEVYWYPLYAYIRRQGHDAEEAKDLTQEFFSKLLEKNYLQDVDRERGKFRSFLLASIRHFLANERDRAHAQKRGGGRVLISLDLEAAERKYVQEPGHNQTPEKIFERRWAMALLDRVLSRLRAEFISANQEERFNHLKEFLTAGKTDIPYSQIATELGVAEGTIKVAVHRLRRRYGEILREEIARTLADPAEVEDEIRRLFSALAL